MMTAAGADPISIEQIFSTDVYHGGGSSGKTVTTGVDISTEGGFIWFKDRDQANQHAIFDPQAYSNGDHWIYIKNLAAQDIGQNIFSASTTGFSIASGLTNSDNPRYNANSRKYVAWSFRKAPKFMDIVTYTGNGSARNISHNLGVVPGMIMIKDLDRAEHWAVYHREQTSSSPEDYYMKLSNDDYAYDDSSFWNDTAPTATQFSIGNNGAVNQNNSSYVAYLFAHNNNDGGFGPDSNLDVIKCGSYTGDGGTNNEVNLGFEPQWVMIKKASSGTTGRWNIFDDMRGFPIGTTTNRITVDQDYAEYEDNNYNSVAVTSTGFRLTRNENWYNANGSRYIYLAIRRNDMTTPTSASEVFNVDTSASTASGDTPSYTSGFVMDMGLYRRRTTTASWDTSTRLNRRRGMSTNSAGAEYADGEQRFDYHTGYKKQASAINDQTAWMWKRAPGYFDVLGYVGNDQANRNITHNLGVAPEMVWIKCRSDGQSWLVDHPALSANHEVYLNANTTQTGQAQARFGTHTSTLLKLVNGTEPKTNSNNQTYIAYLFATLAGISKVGSYDSNGAQQNIDCGFSNGAKFVLVKRIDGSGDWIIFDSVRGITANNDPHLRLNTTAAQDSDGNVDIEPYSSGFTVNYGSDHLNNGTGYTYIFYAIAA